MIEQSLQTVNLRSGLPVFYKVSICHNGQSQGYFPILYDARFTLADPTPRLCLILPAATGRSGAERVQCNCLSEGVVINKTPLPYRPGSRTILYDSLVPTDANVRIARHLANVNGVPTRRPMVLSRLASDCIGGKLGHRISYCEAGMIQGHSTQTGAGPI